MLPLQGKVALVAGATRGAGRGIACMLGEAGATVYCSGRSVRGALASGSERPETIDETAEMVTAYGGRGIAVQADHTIPEQVQALVERINQEQHGQLDIVVNDIWGGEKLTEWGKPFWDHTLDKGMLMLQRGIHTHILTSYYAAPLLVARKSGLIIEITDGDNLTYRGSFFYDLVKTSVLRLAHNQAEDLKPHGITAVAITPGFLRSEEMLTHFGVSEENWRAATKQDPHFIASETPYFIGRAIAALAADPNHFNYSGQALSSWSLSDDYDFTDIDGNRPHWGRYMQEHVIGIPS